MDGNRNIRVVIVDDSSSVRASVRKFLEKSPNILVVGEAANGKEAVLLVSTLSPDVLLLDLEMPVMNGLEAIEELQRQNCPVHILILTGEYDPYTVQETFRLGAKGYILKEDAPQHLTAAVDMACQGLPHKTSPTIKKMGVDLTET